MGTFADLRCREWLRCIWLVIVAEFQLTDLLAPCALHFCCLLLLLSQDEFPCVIVTKEGFLDANSKYNKSKLVERADREPMLEGK